MGALTPATIFPIISVGPRRILEVNFTTVSVNDTWASGRASLRVLSALSTSGTTTQASAGFNVSNSSGTVTLKPGEDGHSATLLVSVD